MRVLMHLRLDDGNDRTFFFVYCGATVDGEGAPSVVFNHAQELVELGLDVPQITRVFLRLKQLGLAVEPVYSVEQAVKTLKTLKGGAADA